jgi:crotonobetainyl-CoA:carnitine CoA-transferase CaiB-like acyl-CoA transferase
LGAVEEKFWAAFCRAVGRPDWIERHGDPYPQTALIAEVTALIAERPLSHWESVIEPADCCFHPVVPMSEVPGHPQITARGLVQRAADDPSLIETLFPAWVDGTPSRPRAPIQFTTAEKVLERWQR